MFFSKSLSSTKLKEFLQEQYQLYLDHPELDTPHFKEQLLELERLIQQKEYQKATDLTKVMKKNSNTNFVKPPFRKAFDLVLALSVALLAATVIRQMWFELYEIPTGSMRPTFREQDRLTVTKTAYGLNIPLQTEHFYFDPTLVQRGSVVIFSGDGIDLPDTDSNFLYVFPYKKRYIKRLIGKPGDTLYFYGGNVYGIDKDGVAINDFKDGSWNSKLEYIPFIDFEGKHRKGPRGEIFFKQMNQEVAKLVPTLFGDYQGEINNGKEWVKDRPQEAKAAHDSPVTLSDLWGMGNYAKSRIITQEGGQKFLEFSHHPSTSTPLRKSLLPLTPELLDQLMNNMYTARFVVKNGKASRYNMGSESFNAKSPLFDKVPDGTYEFYYGKGYQVGFAGSLKELPQDHPLMSRNPENIEKLYNLGIEFYTDFLPSQKNHLLPTRFAYFREGDLYLLGAPVVKKDDPLLKKFVEEETKKAVGKDYLPFADLKSPVDAKTIQNFGLKIPEKHYLVLGDNHAMSGDSRIFGFVPEANLQGAPSLILWPTGERWGIPNMIPYPLFNISRVIVWTLAGVSLVAWYLWKRRRLNRPIVFK